MKKILAGKSIRMLISSALLWIPAALSSCAAALHAVFAAVVVAGTYFTAWTARMQLRLVTFFSRYGASLGEEAATPPEPEPLTEQELDEAQRGDSAETSTRWAASEGTWNKPEEPPKERGLFGGRPPRGSA